MKWVFRQLSRASFLFLCASLAAECGAVKMQATVGFDGAVKGWAWTPLAVRLTNTGSDSVQGTLRVIQQTPTPAAGLSACHAQVNLPPRSKKLYHVYVRLFEFGGDLKVSLVDGSHRIAERTIPINAAGPADTLVVSIGERMSRPSYLSGNHIYVQPARPRGGPGWDSTICVGSISPQVLPDRPAGLESVDCLVISGQAPQSVSRRASEAIAMWVASGGTLVVSTGPYYQNYVGGVFDDLLPVRIEGAVQVSGLRSLRFASSGLPMAIPGMPTPAPSRSITSTPQLGGPVLVAKSTLRPRLGHVSAEQDGVPIVVERDYGAGKVVFLAFDINLPPFSDFPDKAAFWERLLREPRAGPFFPSTDRAAQPHSYSPRPMATQTVSLVEQTPSVKNPSFSTVWLFVAAYLIALGPVNYIALRRRRRLELAWVTTPAIVLVFVLTAYTIGWAIKGRALRIREATFIEASTNASYALATTAASLFSPSKASYQMTAADPLCLCETAVDEGQYPVPTATLGEVSVIEDVRTGMWSGKSFQAASGRKLGGGLKAVGKSRSLSFKGEVQNNLGFELTDCCVVWKGGRKELGSIPSGGKAEIDLSIMPGHPAESASMQSHPAYVRRLRRAAISRAREHDVPVLIGLRIPDRSVFGLVGEPANYETVEVYIFRLDH